MTIAYIIMTIQYGKQAKRLATKRSRKRQKFIPFRKSKLCRCGLCFILPGISFFIALCFYYYFAYFNKSMGSGLAFCLLSSHQHLKGKNQSLTPNMSIWHLYWNNICWVRMALSHGGFTLRIISKKNQLRFLKGQLLKIKMLNHKKLLFWFIFLLWISQF